MVKDFFTLLQFSSNSSYVFYIYARVHIARVHIYSLLVRCFKYYTSSLFSSFITISIGYLIQNCNRRGIVIFELYITVQHVFFYYLCTNPSNILG